MKLADLLAQVFVAAALDGIGGTTTGAAPSPRTGGDRGPGVACEEAATPGATPNPRKK